LRRFSKIKGIDRIIDANINRIKEGLRVCEEITRFILNNRTLTSEFKKIRHEIDAIVKRLPYSSLDLLSARKSLKDIGRGLYINELKRKDFKDIFFANIQRTKESIRVLEEFTKLINKNLAIKFKKLRYDIYEIEKRAVKKLSAICHY